MVLFAEQLYSTVAKINIHVTEDTRHLRKFQSVISLALFKILTFGF